MWVSYSNLVSTSVVIYGNSFLILINSLIKLVPVYDETIIKMKNHQTPITIWLDIVTKYMSERHINPVKPYGSSYMGQVTRLCVFLWASNSVVRLLLDYYHTCTLLNQWRIDKPEDSM